METSKFRTNVGRDGTIKVPSHLLENIDRPTECEIVMRPLRNQKGGVKTVDEVIQDIEESMNAKYPKLKTKIIPQLKKVIGISKDINKKYLQYSDREVIGMARMEKYLEKGEILESLY
ncbi:MAG: hypothetical protein ISS64_09180 [Desulfobacterales bacterium]|uniref:Uncharacterized protein n=1 Tax=Candidatus Desulfatibia profunda TaxID=2841695 RepID=A0A8J6NNX4_9BACT|nr:hypothetical protein [Candidatus Desulfatibia profunda]MBL7196446.1 hypothetical protein [Desulfobacterales bacterium]